ncbi:MAG TPA: Gfo/Idh/MocA family oxidoreductase [Capsulimonadaceae bacterium]|jgi:predicted dehydrogenase
MSLTPVPASSTLGVGIVGFGFIGKVHALAYRSLPLMYDPLPFNARLVGVCTSNASTAEPARLRGGFDVAVTDYRELLERDDIHIIHVCTPNDQHMELLRDAIAAGKHIYCDKPLCKTVDEAEEIAELAKNAPIVHRVTFNNRFVPAIIRAKELVNEGFLGEIYQFRVAYLHAGYVDPNRPFSWRLDMSRSGGGAVMDLGAHAFDLARYLVGNIVEVNAQMETFIKKRQTGDGASASVDVDDIVIAHAKTASGAIGTMEASRLATGVQDELRIEIHGSKGAISYNLMEPNWLTVYDNRLTEGAYGGTRGPQRLECVARYPKPYALGATKNPIGWPQIHTHCLHEFLSDIANGQLGEPSFADGLAVQRIVSACQRSASSRQWENVG